MLDLSDGLRGFTDEAGGPPVTFAEVQALLAAPAGRQPAPRWRTHWRRSGALVTAAIVVAAVVLGVLALTSSPPAKVAIASTTPVVLDVPSTPKLAIKLPSDAVDRYEIKWSKVPAYIPLYLGSSLIGYLTKASVEHPPLIAAPAMRLHLPLQGDRSCPVLGANGVQVVDVFNGAHELSGHIYPNSGFVRLGDEPPCS